MKFVTSHWYAQQKEKRVHFLVLSYLMLKQRYSPSSPLKGLLNNNTVNQIELSVPLDKTI